MIRKSSFFSCAVFLAAAAVLAFAHDPGLSAAVLKLEGARVDLHLTFSRFDIETLTPLDDDGDGKLTQAEFALRRTALQTLAVEAVAVQSAGQGIQPELTGLELDASDGIHFRYSFVRPANAGIAYQFALLSRLPRGHRQYLELLDGADKLIGSRLLEAGANTYELSAALLAELAAQPQVFREFFKLGVEHILMGFDHLAFLFALLLAAKRWRDAAAVITAFTLAHSITLGLATFNLVSLPSKLVEPLIAFSIIYAALENLLRGEIKTRWLLTFGFGLIHGFGFASVLRGLGIGGQGGSAIVPLFSFNLGVELGQMAIAALVLPLLWKLRRQPKFLPRYAPVCSVLIALAGTWWLIERVWL
ncbi:MAG TPA: HupE/UreJ family protein [Blastocatellia bacterium]|nr:HupE/UreJ family protein [Blastocatellia bacterium]HMY71270.1 HupE/UreJ family protein [Blastocatellia bacterium]HMZ17991.1 HupE/UreJ family protein [Blastocatellia bacterium]HNG31512.1 HupE/UreJ family protein [Blastocatellia bacterium]